MAEFKSYLSYRQFAHSITTQWRFSRNAEQADFLRAVLATSVSRQEPIPAGSTLWRAQLSEDQGGANFPSPLGPKRMKPLVNRAREGRANPKGIPYLYLARDRKTAVAEKRPWKGSFVSIAPFQLSRDVRVVNTVSLHRGLWVFKGEPKPEVREREVWWDIDRAFSRPITSGDHTADYAPTQVLAEFFRENGLGGIEYGSSLGPGHNLVLFDLDAATLVKCDIVEIRGVKFDFSLAGNPYFKTPPGSSL